MPIATEAEQLDYPVVIAPSERGAARSWAKSGPVVSMNRMNPSAQVAPIAKHVVLVGAGNAHLQFVKRWRMKPLPGVAVTLVNPTTVIPYSAMVPGHIAGDYAWDDITIDLVRLCQSAGVRLVTE